MSTKTLLTNKQGVTYTLAQHYGFPITQSEYLQTGNLGDILT